MPLPTVTIVGNLTADPELKFTQSGTAVAKLRIATQDRKRDADGNWTDGDPTFLDVTAWRQAAENAAESLSKGDRVVIIGRQRQRSYQTREGENRTVYEVEADEIGASLARATARLNRTTRSSSPTTSDTTVDDPWSTPPF